MTTILVLTLSAIGAIILSIGAVAVAWAWWKGSEE